MKEYLYLSTPWVILTALNFYAGLYRTHVDRVRAGLSPSPQEDNRLSNLIASLLAAPNQDRPFHAEAALLSCLQVILGFLFFIAVSEAMGAEPFSLSLGKHGESSRSCLRLGFPLGKALGKLDPKKDIRRQAPRLSPQGGFSSCGSCSLSMRIPSGLWSSCLRNPFCRFLRQRRKTARKAMRSPTTSVPWAWKARIWIRRSLRSLETRWK